MTRTIGPVMKPMIYNRKRIHSAIGGISPDQFEQMNNFV
jgi:hypothetical protein